MKKGGGGGAKSKAGYNEAENNHIDYGPLTDIPGIPQSIGSTSTQITNILVDFTNPGMSTLGKDMSASLDRNSRDELPKFMKPCFGP